MAAIFEQGIVPFQQFVEVLHTARPEQYLNVPYSKIASEQPFSEIQSYLTNYYASIESDHSFVDPNGSVFDCFPVEKQFSLRDKKGGIAKAPDLPTGPKALASPAKRIVQLHADLHDQFGNRMLAPEGTIPVRRLTIEDLARFSTLHEFFQKSPGSSGAARPPHVAVHPLVAETHRWAHASQAVDNLGGRSFINVWDPAIGANQTFSLSQQWYVAGSGNDLQTAEVGWQVYPQLYNGTEPVFFIYWTADDYHTTGCYNLSCQAFVQTNNQWAIGGALAPWSVAGGPQYEMDFAFYLDQAQGNWWLYAGGEAAANAVGYYPTSIYNGGAMASNAAEIDYGGEVVGTTSFPPMGGGVFADAGWQHAAYQRQIHYFPTTGGVSDAVLTAVARSPQCFTAIVTKYNSPCSETVWFGGPGGNNCSFDPIFTHDWEVARGISEQPYTSSGNRLRSG